MVVSVTAVSVVEREDTVGWLLSWVGRHLVQLLGSGGLVEAVCLGDGELYLGSLLDLIFFWEGRSVSGMGVGRIWLVS